MKNIPYPAIVAAFLLALADLVVYRVPQEAAGVFIVSGLVFGGVLWVYRRYRTARTDRRDGPSPANSDVPK